MKVKFLSTVRRGAAIAVVGLLCFAAGFLLAGSDKAGYTCFYAEITEVYESSLLVDGMEVNDYNHRGEFVFSVSDDTNIRWRGTELNFEDLDTGDNVAIYYSGSVAESYPAQISHVYRIELLDD